MLSPPVNLETLKLFPHCSVASSGVKLKHCPGCCQVGLTGQDLPRKPALTGDEWMEDDFFLPSKLLFHRTLFENRAILYLMDMQCRFKLACYIQGQRIHYILLKS